MRGLTQTEIALIAKIKKGGGVAIEHKELTEPNVPQGYEFRKFQRDDLTELINKPTSANWSEMGCYKTTTGIWLIQQNLSHIEKPRVLIITTKSGKGTYFKHIPALLPDWGLFTVSTKGIAKVMFDIEAPLADFPKDNKRPMIAVAHYHCFVPKRSDILPHLLNSRWDMVLLDEAHRIKNENAKWAMEIRKLRKIPFRHIMTGTGFINNPGEIWNLLNFIDPDTYSAKGAFVKEYVATENYSGYTQVVGIKAGKKNQFRKLVRDAGPRRTLAETHRNLPHPIFTDIAIDLNATQRKMYDAIKEDLRMLDEKGVPIYAANVLTLLHRLRQVCVATPRVVREWYDAEQERTRQEIELIEPSSKLDAVMELLEGLEWDEDRKDQVIIFSNFIDPLKLLENRLKTRKVPYIWMQQKDNDRTRYEKWAVEWPKKNHQVFMCTLQLGSESISLTSAQRAIFLDRSWSPKDNAQAVGRIYRPGQTEAAQIIHVNAKKTVDQRVHATNNKKMGWFAEIFGAEEPNERN